MYMDIQCCLVTSWFYIPINIYPNWWVFFADYFSILLKSFSLYNDMWCFRFRLGFYLIKIFHRNVFVFVQKMICFPKYNIHAYYMYIFTSVYAMNEHRLTSWLVPLIDCWFFSKVAWFVALWVTRLFLSYVYQFVLCI